MKIYIQKTLIFSYQHFKKNLLSVIKFIFLRDENIYYSRYLNSDNFLIIFIKNLFNPKKIITKLKYGFIKFLPSILLSGQKITLKNLNDIRFENYYKKLKADGYLILEAENPKLADYILKKNKSKIDKAKKSNKYINIILNQYDHKLNEIISNSFYLNLIGKYYNSRQPFLRSAPSLKITIPSQKRIPTKKLLNQKSKFNGDWHYDTTNMVQIHFLLHDLTTKDTHMLLAKKSHKKNRHNLTKNDYCYSDEYVYKYYDVIPFVGKKGSVIIWDSNAIHCAFPIPNKKRLFLQILYSPGNDILTDIFDSSYGINLKNKNDLKKLEPISKNVFDKIIL
jgi:hypothetical protein